MNLQNALILLLMFEIGFVLQILKTLGRTMGEESSPFGKGIKRGFLAAVIVGLPTFLSAFLNPRGFSDELVFYCVFVPVLAFTTVLGFHLGFSYQTKLAPKVSRFFVISSFVVCAYLFLAYGANDMLSDDHRIGVQFGYVVPIFLLLGLFLLPLYLKKKFSVNLEVFYYTSALLLLGFFTWSRFSLDFLTDSNSETHRYLLMFQVFICGAFYAYLILQAYFLIQIFELCVRLFWYQKALEPLFGKMKLRQGEEARYENLKKLLSRNFLNDDRGPGVLFLQTIALLVLLVLNFTYSWLDPYLFVTVVFFVLPFLAPLKIDS